MVVDEKLLDAVTGNLVVPIIPMVLVNGTKGIGTGFSTDIMCYNPSQIMDYIRYKLGGSIAAPAVEPFYKNFKGTIRRVADSKYLFKGCYTILDEKKIRITELPVGTWTDDYKKFLEHLIEPPSSKDKEKDKDSDKSKGKDSDKSKGDEKK